MWSRWFKTQGVPVKMTHHMTKPLAPVKRRLTLCEAESGPDRLSTRTQAERTDEEQPSQLLLCDFDHTLADFDTGDYKFGRSFTVFETHP